jgi:Xaa-Pro aminopeptidase
LPHGFPTDAKIGDSSFVLIDWGAEVDHYMSDLTRLIFTSKIPVKLRTIYEIVLQAQLAAIKRIRPGQSLASVDAAARKVIENAGFGPQFGHGTGHSFGLEIHELPYLSPIHEGTLEAGMVVTIEPGIYIPGFGGVRIEDDVLVTADGYEVLSNLPKQIDECTVDLAAKL